MKSLIQLSIAASVVAGVAANSHPHQHLHRHAKNAAGGSKVEKRAPKLVTQYVAGPTETVYQLDGKLLDAEEAQAGLDDGAYVVVGETIPTCTPPPPPPKPTTSSVDFGAQFLEKPSNSPPPPAPTTTSPPPPPAPTTTSQPPPPPQTTKAAPKPKPKTTNSGAQSGGQGLDAKFPSGQIPCSQFPSDYGAIPLDYLGLGGWTTVQRVPDYSPKISVAISNIVTAIKGQSCGKNSMCSYACPVGYQKVQWPSSQGASGQSIGGIYCNSDGMLELTRDGFSTLCEAGMGGVYIQNDLDEVVSTCRTDYPGGEEMNIPAVAQPGQQIPLTNPDQDNYYVWEEKRTTAQYYVNPKGLGPEEACVWTSPTNSKSAGNWAGANIGVGMDSNGITYISVFPNKPTSDALPDFNIVVTGDVTIKCGFVNDQWLGGPNGCTTSLSKGGKAVIRYY